MARDFSSIEEKTNISLRKVTAGVAAAFAGILGLRTCSFVPAGHVKVVDVLGSVRDKVLEPGVNFPVNPLASRVAFDVRTKEAKETMHTPTKEGLMADLDVSILYHVSPDKASEVYKKIGINFEDVIVEPMLRNITRDVVAAYSSEDLYNSNRGKIAIDIESKLKVMYSERGIVLESVLLRDVKLPQEVTSATERKIKAKQEAEQMEYILQKESQEAEKKRIEARGIADAQHIISGSLTPSYLQWKYIDTLRALGDSPNNTFVITPYGQNLLPLVPLDGKSKK